MQLLAELIHTLHWMLVVFMVMAPFSNDPLVLQQHVLLSILLISHWITNANHCAVTYGERLIRDMTLTDNKEEECLTCQIIDPVFKFNSSQYIRLYYVGMTVLMAISFSKLHYRSQITGNSIVRVW